MSTFWSVMKSEHVVVLFLILRAEVYISDCIQQTDKCFKQHTTYMERRAYYIKKVMQLQNVLKMFRSLKPIRMDYSVYDLKLEVTSVQLSKLLCVRRVDFF